MNSCASETRLVLLDMVALYDEKVIKRVFSTAEATNPLYVRCNQAAYKC